MTSLPAFSKRPLRIRRIMILLSTTILVTVTVAVALLFAFQRRLIYFPSAYPELIWKGADKPQTLEFSTSAGRQQAFYVAPRDTSRTPATLWICFAGNASLALDWLGLIERYPQPDAAFLLIDYPGYGHCEGQPSAAGILEGTLGAIEALERHLGGPEPLTATKVRLLGHSLGAAAALQVAPRIQPASVILVSPFTDLMAMARRTVGWPLCQLLRDRFNNRVRLTELAALTPRPALTILHGTSDTVIPIEMSRQLAAQWPDWVHFVEVEGADHFVDYTLERSVLDAMMRDTTGTLALSFPAIRPSS